MPEHVIKTKLEVSGEAEYKKALSEVRAEITLLNKEQKLIEAQFKATGDEQQYAADMTDLLERKLAAQQKTVDTAKAALQQLADKGVEPTDKKYQSWQKTLLTAQTDLLNTQAKLNDLASSQNTAADAADTGAAALQKEKEALESVASSTSVFETVKTKLHEVGGLLGEMNFNAMNAALQNLQKAIDPGKENKTLNDLQSGLSVLTAAQQGAKGLEGVMNTLSKASPFEIAIGAAILLNTTLQQVAAHLDSLEQERRFGWVDQLQSLDAGISEEGVEAIKAGIQRGIEEGVQAADVENTIGQQVARGYAKESYELVTRGYGTAGNIGGAVADVNMDASQKKEEAKASLEAAQAAEQEALMKALDAGNTDEAAAAQERLNQAEQEYQDTLRDIERERSERLSAVASGSASIVGENIDADQLNQQLEDMRKAYNAFAYLQENMGTGLFDWDPETGETTINEMGRFVSELLHMSEEELLNADTLSEGGVMDQLAQKLSETAAAAMENGLPEMADVFQSWADAGALDGVDFSQASGALLAAYRASLIKQASGEDAKLDRDELFSAIAGSAFQSAGSLAAQSFTDSVADNAGVANASGQTLGNETLDGVKTALDEHSPSRQMEILGENAAIGLAKGLRARAGDVRSAALYLANIARTTIQSALQIASPSRVFESLGSFVAMGFAEGINAGAADVADAMSRMISVTGDRSPVPVSILRGDLQSEPARGTTASGTVRVTLMLDRDVLGDTLAPIVNERIGADIKATRRY